MQYQKQAQLRDYNSFRTEAKAKLVCKPQSIKQLRQALKDYPNEEKLIIGGGCNLFFTKDYDGLAIVLNLKGIKKLDKSDDKQVYLEVQATEDWDEFVEYCVQKEYSGLENLSLIPGTVGASPVQNIGAYGAEVKDCIENVRTIHKTTGEERIFSNEDCMFGYRDSLFKRSGEYIICSVVFKLSKEFHYTPKYIDLNKELEAVRNPKLREVRDAVIRVRQRKLPSEKELPNAGSFFKNPEITEEKATDLQKDFPNLPKYPLASGMVKTAAAFLIDQAGYKDFRDGNIGTYPNQPLVIVNYGTSNGNEIVKFKKKIQQAVKDKFGIELEAEVRIF